MRGILEVIAVSEGCGASCNSRPLLGRSLQTVHRRNRDYITAFHLDGWIICSIFTLKEMDVICCNYGFVSGPTVVQFQKNPTRLNPDPAGFRRRISESGIRQKINIRPSLLRISDPED